MLDVAPAEKTIVKQAIRDGRQPPGAMKNTPELRMGLALYLDAFFDLDSERSHGSDTLSPIPWSKIFDYAKAWEFDEDQTEDLLYFVRQLDNEHLKRMAAEMKRKAREKPIGKRFTKPSKALRPRRRTPS